MSTDDPYWLIGRLSMTESFRHSNVEEGTHGLGMNLPIASVTMARELTTSANANETCAGVAPSPLRALRDELRVRVTALLPNADVPEIAAEIQRVLPLMAARMRNASGALGLDAIGLREHLAIEVAVQYLHRRYGASTQRTVAWLVRDAEVEDVCGRVWMDVTRTLQRDGCLRHAKALLYTITYARCRDAIRAKARRPRTLELNEQLRTGLPGVSTLTRGRDLIEKMLSTLSDEERLLYLLNTGEDCSAEIGAILGCSSETARQRWHRLKARLRELHATIQDQTR